jgi:hypothetical protein
VDGASGAVQTKAGEAGRWLFLWAEPPIPDDQVPKLTFREKPPMRFIDERTAIIIKPVN